MKITIAKTAGFCMGVRRAVEMALAAPDKHQAPIATYGPLIHNPQVLELLERKGVAPLGRIPAAGEGTVLIRAHGVPPEAKAQLESAGFQVIDATCPRVIRVQTIIGRHSRKGYQCIIIGDRDHPEVIGLLGFAGGNGVVVDTLEALEALPAYEQAIVVAQTTQNTRLYDRVREYVARCHPHYRVFDTICDSTERRQAEVKALAESVDALVVVGGKSSGNTQRLAEIGRGSGIPTFHIETEDDLDIAALSGYRAVGLTAGASTPNWIIKRVYRALESAHYGRTRGWFSTLFNMERALLLTNIYVALGAGCLCYACCRLQGIGNFSPYVLITMLYVLSMHIFNNLIGRKADRYNDPDRARFYDRRKIALSALALVAGAAGLLTAFAVGHVPFLVLLVMSLLGLSYNLRLFPARMAGGRFRRIRDIPGSKTLLIALAWGVVTALFPPMAAQGGIRAATVPVFLVAVCLVFARTAFFDFLDMQGDRIVGRGTIPILLGEERTMKLLFRVLAVALALLLVTAAAGLIPTLGFALCVCPVFLFVLFAAHGRGYMLPGIRLEFLVETQFILAGGITLFWSLL